MKNKHITTKTEAKKYISRILIRWVKFFKHHSLLAECLNILMED